MKIFNDAGYRLDGIEGYIYELCTPEPSCIPAGATRLYRLYNPTLDDYVVIPESLVTDFQGQGYVFQTGLNDWIGYVYENLDTDGDTLIDGFESLIGTSLSNVDSDGDGLSDGAEILVYPYSDPLDGPICDSIFVDSFESGSPAAWAAVVTAGSGQLGVDTTSAIVGPFGMFAETHNSGDQAWVRDDSPASETFYRASFHFEIGSVRIAHGNQHNILIARDDNPSQWVTLITMRRNGLDYQLRARTRLDNGSVLSTSWVTFASVLATQTSHRIELIWEGGDPGASNGSLSFSVDSTTEVLSALDNDSHRIDHVRLGMVSGIDALTEGTFFFDEFNSCRE